MIYYHGGKAGLNRWDMLVPSPPHETDGCPVCVARTEGRTLRAGEFRQWALSQGSAGADLALSLAEVDPWEPIDPPSAEEAVYITTELPYARWYAARSQGDLYRVTPVGELTPSPEDNFPSWTVPEAQIVEVLRRRVRLDQRERRQILSLWQEADKRAGRIIPQNIPSLLAGGR